MAKAMNNYESAHGHFPSGEVHAVWNDKNRSINDHYRWVDHIGMWMNAILPQMEQQKSHDQLVFEKQAYGQYATSGSTELTAEQAIQSDPNLYVSRDVHFEFLLCPSDPYTGRTSSWGAKGWRARIVHYYGVAGDHEYEFVTTKVDKHYDGTYSVARSDIQHGNANNGVLWNDSMIRLSDITDGTSQTAIIAETWGRDREFPPTDDGNTTIESRGMNLHTYAYFEYTPNSSHNRPWRCNSFHAGGAYVAFCDGSVHFVSDAVAAHVFAAIGTIAGGEVYDKTELD
jgi:prepilin-type processing-associated H-X9-DG protein